MNILLTGVSTGIGYTTAEFLLNRGHRVFGTVRRPADAAELTTFNKFHRLTMDVTDRASIRAAAEEVAASGHPLHAVINNAGIAVAGPLETIAEADYRKQFDVNVFGNLAVCQLFLPLLHAAREAGEPNLKIINVSSVSGYVTAPFTSLYSASKFAVEALTDGLRRELYPYDIDVISIAPGPVKTPIWDKAKSQTKAFAGTRYEHILDQLNDYTDQAAAGGVEPLRVAQTIHALLVADHPRPDRLVMNRGWMMGIVRNLPKRWQDWVFRKNMSGGKRY